eukprot:TRINITY_DN6209_c0_g1_i1.p1 TRINITY_DN6209_c0_g1~~TRINITY_DN6209_c0_g1_i1.p1  ORF type:complete len:1761 (-),score=372.85 TRINITY_DN6209_c0_g1_i1:32-5032(-)
MDNECKQALTGVSCMPCAPDNFIWNVNTFSDHYSFDICKSYCDSLVISCSDATLTDDDGTDQVSTLTGTEFCYRAFGTAGNNIINVVDGSRSCYDPILGACEEKNIEYTYSECNGGKHHLTFQWNPDSECAGGVKLPDPISDLDCPISCGEGSFLPLGENTCQDCSSGTYSIGGGRKVEDWTLFHHHDINFDTFCLNRYGELMDEEECAGWQLKDTYIDSGIKELDYISSVLKTELTFVKDGFLSFLAKIDCEYEYDRLTLVIDDAEPIWVQNSIDEKIYTFPISAGAHTIQWIFSKDYVIGSGADSTVIWWIEFSGLYFNDDYCHNCHPGYTSLDAASECTICPKNTHAPSSGSEECTACLEGEYSFEGSSECSEKLPCTEENIDYFYTPCTSADTMEKYWKYTHPCDEDDPSSYALPESETISCSFCDPGQFRQGAECLNCPNGQYSDDGLTCKDCGAGYYAPPTLLLDIWNEYPEGATSSCLGLCGDSQWRPRGLLIDSGIDHGDTVDINFIIPIDIVSHIGHLKFEYQIFCEGLCYFEMYVDEKLELLDYHSSDDMKTSEHELSQGNHLLEFVFQKYYGARGKQRVEITYIEIQGAEGGSDDCLACKAGSYSEGSSRECFLCDSGQYSGDTATECETCPENTYSDGTGQSYCHPCGVNTYTPAGSSECSINDCVYTPDNGHTTYDLNPLSRTDEMWGPIFEATQYYYANPCSKKHSNHSCYTEEGEPMKTYVCEHVTDWGHATDLGHIMGYYPYPIEGEGVILTFTDGTPACGNELLGQPDVPRTSNITVICDPEAGIGVFSSANPIYVGTEYPHVCTYNFEWRTLYGCPVCTTDHYKAILAACQGGRQEVIFEWKENPKRCHSGVSLPPSEFRHCSIQDVCNPGYFFSGNGTCSQCHDGEYSIGSGTIFNEFDNLIPSFFQTSECEDCQPWFATYNTLRSGSGSSKLFFETNFIVDAPVHKIEFEAKVVSINDVFTLSIDNIDIIKITDSTHEFTKISVDVTTGSHLVSFEFSGNPVPGHRDSYVEIRNIEIYGNTQAQPLCTECPRNTKSDSISCTPCGKDYYSNDQSECLPCYSDMYRLPGQNLCFPNPTCDIDLHYNIEYGACVNRENIKSYVPIEPFICNGTTPEPITVPCPECPKGLHFNGVRCVTCQSEGKSYYDSREDKCKPSVPGTTSVLSQYYFWNVGTKLDSKFSTRCYGDCATSGWQAHNGVVETGIHFGMVEVVLSLSVEVVEGVDPFITYKIKYTSENAIGASETQGYQLLIDDIPMDVDVASMDDWTTETVYLKSGTHEITWIYYQESTTFVGMAIKEIQVRGSVYGSSNALVECPAGYTSVANGHCTKCPAGTYSAHEGSTTCEPCTAGEMSTEGSIECHKCSLGTVVNSEQTDCTTSCIFKLPDIETHFDLRDLDRVYISTNEGEDYSISLCEKEEFTTCTDDSTDCEYYYNYLYSVLIFGNIQKHGLGSTLSFVPYPTLEQGQFSGLDNEIETFSLVYTNPDYPPIACEDGFTSTVRFICKSDEGVGFPELVSRSQCSVDFKWVSEHACPTCLDADFKKVALECIGENQIYEYKKLNNCYGSKEDVSELGCVNIHLEKGVRLGLIIGFAFLIILLLGAIAYCYRKRSKAEEKYGMLMMEIPEDLRTAVGMSHVDLDTTDTSSEI